MGRPRRHQKPITAGRVLTTLLLAALVFGYDWYRRAGKPEAQPTEKNQPTANASKTSDQALVDAIRNRQSNVIVQSGGSVFKLLPDDRDGDSHQRFLVRLVGGETILIAHNIDLADRVPARVGDVIAFKGEYEWNEQGGVIHWTHRDPAKRHGDGWLEHGRKKYQ